MSEWHSYAGPLCLRCADLDHLVYMPAGDAALTRREARARVRSEVGRVIAEWREPAAQAD